MWIAIVSGVLIGAILGLMGAGGGILAVPVLVAGLGWTMQQAAPVALLAVTAGAVVGVSSQPMVSGSTPMWVGWRLTIEGVWLNSTAGAINP